VWQQLDRLQTQLTALPAAGHEPAELTVRTDQLLGRIESLQQDLGQLTSQRQELAEDVEAKSDEWQAVYRRLHDMIEAYKTDLYLMMRKQKHPSPQLATDTAVKSYRDRLQALEHRFQEWTKRSKGDEKTPVIKVDPDAKRPKPEAVRPAGHPKTTKLEHLRPAKSESREPIDVEEDTDAALVVANPTALIVPATIPPVAPAEKCNKVEALPETHFRAIQAASDELDPRDPASLLRRLYQFGARVAKVTARDTWAFWRTQRTDPLFREAVEVTRRTFQRDAGVYLSSSVFTAATDVLTDITAIPNCSALTLYDLICSPSEIHSLFERLVTIQLRKPRKRSRTRIDATGDALDVIRIRNLFQRANIKRYKEAPAEM
jgi:hypothetical protein